MALQLSNTVIIPDDEIDIQAVRASGPGGQHVNKTASAAHLFFDIRTASLPDHYKSRLFAHSDQRITKDGLIVIKVQDHRSLEKNRELALERLAELIRAATKPQKLRRPTRPSRRAKARRVDAKKKSGQTKALRGRIRPD